MKRKVTFAPGVGIPSVILMVVVLCMSILAVLAFMSARNDKALADRSAEVTVSVYRVDANAERTLSQIDELLLSCGAEAADTESYREALAACLPEGVYIDTETGVISWTEEDGGRTLLCEIDTGAPGEAVRYSWRKHTLLAATEEDTWN